VTGPGFQSIIPPYNTSTGLLYLLELSHSENVVPLAHGDLGTVAGKDIGGFHEFYSKTAPAGYTPPFSYYATEDWTFSTTDAQVPNRWYDGRLNKAGQISRTVTLAAVDSSAYSVSLGSIELANGDGDLDEFPDIPNLINSQAIIKVGQRGQSYSTFQTLATGIVVGVDVGSDLVTIELGGMESLLQRRFYGAKYDGTGGVEGAASLADVTKPVVLGRVFNIAPVLIEPLTYIFQAHYGTPLAAITAVRHGGGPMIFDANYPTYAALAAVSPAIGHYSTCLAQGLIKVGLDQSGANGALVLTMDCETVNTTASTLARQVAESALLVLEVPFDVAAFDLMETQDGSYVYGRYLTEFIDYSDVLSDLMRNMNRYWGISRTGKLTTAKLNTPSNVTDSGLSWDIADLLDVDRIALPDGFRAPHNERSVTYAYNWTVQSTLAAAYASAVYTKQSRSVTRTPSPILTNAVTPPTVESYLRTSTSAASLATALLNLHGKNRYMYTAQASILSGLPGLLESIVVDYPRFGLDGGKRCVVVGSVEDYDAGTVLLTLWR
jgi:hypothetical protein